MYTYRAQPILHCLLLFIWFYEQEISQRSKLSRKTSLERSKAIFFFSRSFSIFLWAFIFIFRWSCCSYVLRCKTMGEFFSIRYYRSLVIHLHSYTKMTCLNNSYTWYHIMYLHIRMELHLDINSLRSNLNFHWYHIFFIFIIASRLFSNSVNL